MLFTLQMNCDKFYSNHLYEGKVKHKGKILTNTRLGIGNMGNKNGNTITKMNYTVDKFANVIVMM